MCEHRKLQFAAKMSPVYEGGELVAQRATISFICAICGEIMLWAPDPLGVTEDGTQLQGFLIPRSLAWTQTARVGVAIQYALGRERVDA